MLSVSPTCALSAAQVQAYRVLAGKVMGKREGMYFETFGTTSDAATDPDGKHDRWQRTVTLAKASGFSTATAYLSGQQYLKIRVNGNVATTTNPIFGVISVYRSSISRHEHGLKPNASSRQSGRKRRREVKRSSSEYRRLYYQT